MKLVVGNWKMNGRQADLEQLEWLCRLPPAPDAEMVICPPWTLLSPFRDLVEARGASHLRIGAQDCHTEPGTGAHTGDVSASMLADARIRDVIVGHSERRAAHGETDAVVRAKAEAAMAMGLLPILCIGESLAERDAGDTGAVLERQLAGSLPQAATPDRLAIAYEPIWAIGTGRTPTLAEIEAAMRSIAGVVGHAFRILYGGSVKPDNAQALMATPGVSGVLVGGASLHLPDFHAIAMAAG